MTDNARCARCGKAVDFGRLDVVKMPKRLVPADIDVPHAVDGSLVHVFCPSCWPAPTAR